MEFYQTIHNRRSVRKYKSDPIPEDALNRICEAFRAAPSWANTQPWELILVSDDEVKTRLQETLSDGNPAARAMVQAPLLVCVIGIENRSGWYRGKPVTKRGDWMLFDLGIATEHLVLAAAAEGLGTVHAAYFDYEKAGNILGIPEGRTIVELVPLGYPDHDPRPVSRKPLEEFLYRNRYGSKY
jgi:nitroreductase